MARRLDTTAVKFAPSACRTVPYSLLLSSVPLPLLAFPPLSHRSLARIEPNDGASSTRLQLHLFCVSTFEHTTSVMTTRGPPQSLRVSSSTQGRRLFTGGMGGGEEGYKWVPTYEWQDLPGLEVVPGLEVKLPLGGGGARMARIPEEWQMRVWIGDSSEDERDGDGEEGLPRSDDGYGDDSSEDERDGDGGLPHSDDGYGYGYGYGDDSSEDEQDGDGEEGLPHSDDG